MNTRHRMRPWWRILSSVAVAVALLGVGSGTSSAFADAASAAASPGQSGESISDLYSATGPWDVTTGSGPVPQDGGGSTLVYPTDLGADDYQHPIVIWGNGADTSPLGNYEGLLVHLASWGYVVVAPNQANVLASHGVEAGEWAVAQDSDPGSIFFGKLDTDKVAALGHSRGTQFTTWMWEQSPGLLTTAVAFSAPDRIWWEGTIWDQALCVLIGICPMPTEPDWTQVESMFLIAGDDERLCLDFYGFPICADDFGFPLKFVSEEDQQYLFDQVNGSAARAAVVGGDHHVVGQTVTWGYATAWLKYVLEGDQFARGAFVGEPAEINADPAWTWQEQKNLP
jgi:hypothetical protein